MGNYQTIQSPIEAVRYGTEEGGEWYAGAVDTVARFLLRIDTPRELSNFELMSVVRPSGAWDPPSESNIEWFGNSHGTVLWRPIRLGDWLIRFPDGYSTTIRHEDFVDNYEKRPD